MKKSNNIITDWLEEHGDPEIEKQVEEEMDNYKKSVMQRAWSDYKIKKAHKGYGDWTFAESLYWAHRTIKGLRTRLSNHNK